MLLVKARTPDTGIDIWLTPGGGVEPGEDDFSALTREIWEETGARISAAEGPVWWRAHTYRIDQQPIRQTEYFYLVRLPLFKPSMANNPALAEVQAFKTFRWWTVEEILSDTGTFVPTALASHLVDLLASPVPQQPVHVGL